MSSPAEPTVAPRSLVAVAHAVAGPEPLLGRDAEAALTPRQQEILATLHDAFADGFAHLTMADMAATAACSLRTLYDLAASKDELVRLVVDHRIWAIGRAAMVAIDDDADPLEALRAYLHAGHHVVASFTAPFAADLDADPGTKAIKDAHTTYFIAVARELLDEAVARGVVAPIDAAAVARVVATVAADFIRPDVLATLRSPAQDAADAVVDVVLAGLRARS